MKKIYIYITFIALAALSFGCAKEIESPEEEFVVEKDSATDGEEFTVTLSVPDSEDTKTSLGSKSGSTYPVYWSDGDGDFLSLNGTAASSSNKNSTTQYSATFKPASGLSVYNFL